MAPPPPAADVVQKLLGELRLLKVENEKLRAEVEELRARVGKPDPRLQSQEEQIQRLRGDLAAARDQRDVVTDGIRQAIDRLTAALAEPK